jgi:hypothetical protein
MRVRFSLSAHEKGPAIAGPFSSVRSRGYQLTAIRSELGRFNARFSKLSATRSYCGRAIAALNAANAAGDPVNSPSGYARFLAIAE